MATYNVPPGELARVFASMEHARMERVAEAVHEACMLGAEVVAKAAPVDTGMLKGSVRSERLAHTRSRILVDAPHAGIVELGSRPHMPPLKPILMWVRHHKADFSGAGPSRDSGQSKPRRAMRLSTRIRRVIRKWLRRLGIGASATRKGGARAPTPELTDAQLEQIARAIQHKIAKEGTRPTHFVRRQIPRLRRILGATIKRRIKDPR